MWHSIYIVLRHLSVAVCRYYLCMCALMSDDTAAMNARLLLSLNNFTRSLTGHTTRYVINAK